MPVSWTAVPLRPNGQAFAAVPVVVQLNVLPFRVPVPVPVTGMVPHVAEYAIDAALALVGAIDQVIDVHAPASVAVVVDRHVPLKVSIVGVVLAVGDVVAALSQAAIAAPTISASHKVSSCLRPLRISHHTTRTNARRLAPPTVAPQRPV